MVRAVVIRTMGDAKMADAIADGMSRVIPIRPKQTASEVRAAKLRRERNAQKLAQFRAAALAKPKWWEYVVAAIFEAFWGIFRAFAGLLKLTLKLPGKVGWFFRRLHRWLLSDSHLPYGGLIGIAVCYGLFGVAVCKLIIAMRYFW